MPDRNLAPLDQLPFRNEPLAKAKPFLMPRGGPNDTHSILPPEKENRKIRFQEEILVTEIENRFYLNDFPEDDEEGSYEIEIVEDDGDADFYLEIVDGEVFYVFETEDDISLESEGSVDADGNPQQDSHQHNNNNKQQQSRTAKDEDMDINDELNASMFINFEDMMLAPDLEGSDDEKDEGPPMEIAFEPDTEMIESLNHGSQFMDLDNLMESSDEGDEKEKESQRDEALENQSNDLMEAGASNTRDRNSRMTSEETLLVMEDDADPEPSKPSPCEEVDLDMEGTQEIAPAPVPEKPATPVISVEPQSSRQNHVEQQLKAPFREPSPNMEETRVVSDLDAKPETESSKSSPDRKSFEKPTVSTAPEPSKAKKPWTTPKSTAAPDISTESTTARMIRERPNTDSAPRPFRESSPEPSTSSKPTEADDYNYNSPLQNSPTRTKSILKCNPASPVKAPRKDRTKNKKSTKTFSKTYVRADQLDGEHRVYAWAKPDWTNKKQELRPTGRADALREGKLEAPITFFPKKPVNDGVDSEADMEELVKKAMKAGTQATSIFGFKKNLKVSVNGAKLRDGQDIVKPITQATILRQPENINKVANPGRLKPTAAGEGVRKGASLSAPVTFPALKYDDTNQVANPNVLRRGAAPGPKKQYEWSKPDWIRKAHLRNTPVGEAVKKGADLQGPITQAPHGRRKSFDNISLASSDSGMSNEAIAPPRRGRRNVPPRASSLPSSNHSADSGPGSGELSPSQRSSDSKEGIDCVMSSYEQEKLRKEKEQKERQERLARMARAWQQEEQSKNPYY